MEETAGGHIKERIKEEWLKIETDDKKKKSQRGMKDWGGGLRKKLNETRQKINVL